MKKLLVLSDTHGNLSSIESLKGIMRECDYVIHLGDYQRDMLAYKEFGDKLYTVKGNCDGSGDDLIIQIENLKILLTHGDRYGVKQGVDNLIAEAKAQGVDAVFFGHTHDAFVEFRDGLWLVNPGATKSFYKKTYCYAVVCDKQLTAKIVPIF